MVKLIFIQLLFLIGSYKVQKEELVIFHAGSFSKTMNKLIELFKKNNPNIDVKREIAGSIECARKITDLNKNCDVFISSDYQVIENYLFPKYSNWDIRFATNELVIAFTQRSRRSNEINSKNWFNILSDYKVKVGRSEPNSDPCGYRTIITLKLAEKFYGIKQLSKKILDKNPELIRPKEVDLLALLELGEADFIFTYRSLAILHKLKFISLPDEINLGNPDFNEYYQNESVKLNGKNPKEKNIQTGKAIFFSVTIPHNSLHKKNAIMFVDLLLSKKGKKIIEENGQKFINPILCSNYNFLPEELKKHLITK